MKLRRPILKKLFKNQKAVSQVLAAMMMIFLFITAIAVVWAWLYPTYRRFQTTNTLNTITSYFLRIDESIYDLYGEGPGSIETIRIDPTYGRVLYEAGKNATLHFSDENGAYSQNYLFTELGTLTYLMQGRRGVLLNEGEHRYLKGPSLQSHFFVNGSNDNLVYQGLTNLTLLRPEDNTMRIELEYRVRIYSWFDQNTNTLSIIVNIIQLDIKGLEFEFFNTRSLKITLNSTREIYFDTTNVDSDFYVDGSIAPTGFDPSERALWFVKPGAIANYDVNIQIVLSQFLFYY
ncbi:MAG: hypothetical protein FK731_00405 [Asgard group archaeon]|nr:hypothetical protein [Asgard group archaeon]